MNLKDEGRDGRQIPARHESASKYLVKRSREMEAISPKYWFTWRPLCSLKIMTIQEQWNEQTQRVATLIPKNENFWKFDE